MDRGRFAGIGAAAAFALALGTGCGGSPSTVEPAWVPGAGAAVDVVAHPFSGEQALEDARALARHATRTPGSRDAKRARAHIRRALDEMGATSETWAAGDASAPGGGAQPAGTAAVIGALPGTAEDVILLAAAYDAPASDTRSEVDAVTEASGAAALLELGRSLAARPRPYTIWLAFVEGDAGSEALGDGAAGRFAGTRALVGGLSRRGLLGRVRLAVFFAALADEKLRIVRDLRSHRVHREAFWDSARALGLVEVFVPGSGFASPDTGHRAFLAGDLRGVVAIVGDSLVQLADPADRADRDVDDAWSAAATERLDEFGAVTLDALDRIADRLSRIDGFARAPLANGPWEDEAEPAGEREEDDDSAVRPDAPGASAPAGGGSTRGGSGAGGADGAPPPAAGSDGS